jgi:hypothetical protein
MFFIEQYLPEVYSLSPRMPKFAETVYHKVQDLYEQIRGSDYKPKTIDEYNCVNSLLKTIQDSEKMVIQFLPIEFPVKRIRNFVDYTGMDTIEPECDSDAIAAIWNLVDSVWYDSDYDPEEEEEDDDDDEVDVYLVDEVESIVGEEPEEDEHDYSEDEDYVPEDDVEDVVSEIAARVTVGYQGFREGNHTWFIYDDEC